ncbi:MAG: sigma-70 family RNA polymerase sigma factor [Phycisphaerales bacterium]|nr:sigma-70 family RNA polymerase sigma factor [Phycisphaerales bacterium]
MDHLEQSGAGFRTTRWSLVDALGDTRARPAAREILFEAYWPPVYAYLRRRGHSRDAAAELTQAFFADVAVKRELFGRAEPSRGRLRSLIVAALSRYLVDCGRRAAARGGTPAPLPAADVQREEDLLPELAERPDDALAGRWELGRLHEALAECRRHFENAGKAGHWRAFDQRVLRPTVACVEPRPLAEVAAELGFRTPADAAAAVQVVKKRLAALLAD